mgnify:CR=1 FL=1
MAGRAGPKAFIHAAVALRKKNYSLALMECNLILDYATPTTLRADIIVNAGQPIASVKQSVAASQSLLIELSWQLQADLHMNNQSAAAVVLFVFRILWAIASRDCRHGV